MSRPHVSATTLPTTLPGTLAAKPGTGRIMVIEDLFALPGHSRVWIWPVEELKKVGITLEKKTDKRYFFRVVPDSTGAGLGAGTLTVEMCRIERIFDGRKTNYDEDVKVEHIFRIPMQLFETLKYLTSPRFKEELDKQKQAKKERMEIERKEERQKFINTYIPATDVEFRMFVNNITRDYLTEFFGDISVFNLEALTKVSLVEFQNNLAWFAHMWNSTSTSEETKQDILNERMFYNHYSFLAKLGGEVVKICLGKDYESPAFKNSLLKKLNHKYNSRIVEFITKKSVSPSTTQSALSPTFSSIVPSALPSAHPSTLSSTHPSAHPSIISSTHPSISQPTTSAYSLPAAPITLPTTTLPATIPTPTTIGRTPATPVTSATSTPSSTPSTTSTPTTVVPTPPSQRTPGRTVGGAGLRKNA